MEPVRFELNNLRIANAALSQLSYGPDCPVEKFTPSQVHCQVKKSFYSSLTVVTEMRRSPCKSDAGDRLSAPFAWLVSSSIGPELVLIAARLIVAKIEIGNGGSFGFDGSTKYFHN